MKCPQDTLTHATGLLILRLGMGGYMLTHGWGKLLRLLDGQVEGRGAVLGMNDTLAMVLLVFAEFACALLIMFGLVTRLATIPLIFAMAVAAFLAHGADPWTAGEAARLYRAGEASGWGSKQPALMFLIPFLALTFTGPGRLSLDAIIRSWLDARRAAAAPADASPASGP